MRIHSTDTVATVDLEPEVQVGELKMHQASHLLDVHNNIFTVGP